MNGHKDKIDAKEMGGGRLFILPLLLLLLFPMIFLTNFPTARPWRHEEGEGGGIGKEELSAPLPGEVECSSAPMSPPPQQ